jgi:hypothetical protein
MVLKENLKQNNVYYIMDEDHLDNTKVRFLCSTCDGDAVFEKINRGNGLIQIPYFTLDFELSRMYKEGDEIMVLKDMKTHLEKRLEEINGYI